MKVSRYAVQPHLIWSTRSMEVIPGKRTSSIKLKRISFEQKSHLKYETQIWRNAVLSSSRDKL